MKTHHEILSAQGLLSPDQFRKSESVRKLLATARSCIAAMCAERIQKFSNKSEQQIDVGFQWNEALELVWKMLMRNAGHSESEDLNRYLQLIDALESDLTLDHDLLDSDIPGSTITAMRSVMHPDQFDPTDAIERYLSWCLERVERANPHSVDLRRKYTSGEYSLAVYLGQQYGYPLAQSDLQMLEEGVNNLAKGECTPNGVFLMRRRSVN